MRIKPVRIKPDTLDKIPSKRIHDYEDRFLLNTRDNLEDQVSLWYHGLKQEALRGTMDKYECIRKI